MEQRENKTKSGKGKETDISKPKRLVEAYEKSRNDIVSYFLLKHKLNGAIFENGWLCVEDINCCVSFEDMFYDVEKNIDSHMFTKWYSYNMNMYIDGYSYISYTDFINGERHIKRSFICDKLFKIKNYFINCYYLLRYKNNVR